MHLNLVAQTSELLVNMRLLRFRLLARFLELDQQWLPTRQPKKPVRETGVAEDVQLRAEDAEVLPHQVDRLLLDLIFRLDHLNS